jgi:hypothetical protein
MVRFPTGARYFCHPDSVQTGCGAPHNASSLLWRAAEGVKLTTPPSCAKVKNVWSYTATPATRLFALMLNKEQGELYYLRA